MILMAVLWEVMVHLFRMVVNMKNCKFLIKFLALFGILILIMHFFSDGTDDWINLFVFPLALSFLFVKFVIKDK